MRRATLLATLLLLSALEVSALARHSYDRGVGHKQGYRPTHREGRRIAAGPIQDVKISIPQLGQQLEALQRANPDRMRLTVLRRINGMPMYRVDLSDPAQRTDGPKKLSVLVTAGVHGNEPTGVRAAVQLIDKALHDKALLKRYSFTVLPDVNPVGLTVVQRLNGAVYNKGRDVNRSFVAGKWTRESAAIRKAFGKRRFHLALDLHGAVDSGFFMYRHKDDGMISRRVLSAMASGVLLDPKGPHGRALGSVQEPLGCDLESFMGQRSDYCYTLEYPRTIDPRRQLQGLSKLLTSALNNVRRYGRFQDAKPITKATRRMRPATGMAGHGAGR